MKYTLYVSEIISTAVDIEAETLDDAIDQFYIEGMPGVMFLNHKYPDEGEWEVDEEAARLDYPEDEEEN
jgi:hypothetical protein